MPFYTKPIGDTEDSITRPIAYQVTRELFKACQIPITRIYYNGDYHDAQRSTSFNEAENDQEENYLRSQNYATVTVTEEEESQDLHQTYIAHPNSTQIYRDVALESYMVPSRVLTRMRLVLELQFTDRSTAETSLKYVKSLVRRFGRGFPHRLHYSYLIPEEFMLRITEMHTLRERVQGYGDTLGEYLKKHLAAQVTVESDMAGNNQSVKMVETLDNVFGFWEDVDGNLKATKKEDDTEAYGFEINYTFHYQKPDMISMQHPLLVHNQRIPKWMLPTGRLLQLDNFKNRLRQADFDTAVMDAFSEHNFSYNIAIKKDGMFIPEYDDFNPKNIVPSTWNLLTLLMLVEQNDLPVLFNLNQIKNKGLFTMRKTLWEFFKTETRWLHKRFGSVFQVNLYRSTPAGIMQDHDTLRVSPELDFTVTPSMKIDLRDVYHVRISLVTDLWRLDDEARRRLEGSDALKDIISLIDPNKPIDENKDPKDIIDDLIKKSINKSMKTVQTFGLTAHRRSRNAINEKIRRK